MRYQVWDTAQCKRLTLGELVRPDSEQIRLAKILADEVVGAFTGMPGVAGTEIAFISDRTGEREVYVMDADGGRPRRATAASSTARTPHGTIQQRALQAPLEAAMDRGVPGGTTHTHVVVCAERDNHANRAAHTHRHEFR